MEWLKALLPLIQTGLKMYVSGQIIQKAAQDTKSIALRSSIIAFGAIAALIFFAAAIIMIFVDLGLQFEVHEGIHFSGMMLSSIFLCGFALLIFGICFGVSKYLAIQEKNKKELQPVESPYAPLLVFAEEFLERLVTNLNQPKSQTKAE